jgi:hypothetical protein
MTFRRFISQTVGHLILATLLTSSLAANAITSGWNTRITQVRISKGTGVPSYRQDDLRIPVNSECEKILIQTQQRLKRELTHAEIRDLLPKILLVTGEQLEVVPQSSGRRSCFTAQMKVLTPSGEVPISRLKEGDPVISIDLATGTPVTNFVRKSIATPGQEFGTLINHQRPLEVTGSERFFTDGGKFTELAQIAESCNLFQVNLKQPSSLVSPVQRGTHRAASVRSTVFNLELIGEPRNFIVEGLLVHNIKESM